jgi:hypothetical protein
MSGESSSRTNLETSKAQKDLLQELLKRETSIGFIYWAAFSFSSGK